MDLELFIIVRLIAVGACFLLLTILIAGSVRLSLKIPLAGLVIGAAAYLVNADALFDPLLMAGRLIDLASLSTPFWIWLFARELYERAAPLWLLALIAALYLTGWAIAHFIDTENGVGFYIIHILSLTLVIDLMIVSISGLKDDLVQRRRLIRIYLPVLIGLQSGGILIYELIYGTDPTIMAQTVNGLMVFAVILFAGIALLRTDATLLVETDSQKHDKPREHDLSPSESVLKDRLNAMMVEGDYRETGLTIQSLAKKLATPEHRLRGLINGKLGHRNFSSFLNGYRINEAKEKLADRELVDLPILTIAMDLGYNSLAPFNRAFRSEAGMTPSDFRKQAIDQK
ncbi:MAG: helix-turn-helix domain-containing protein [Sphingorhabdus sp.]